MHDSIEPMISGSKMAKTVALVSCDGTKFSEIDVDVVAECKTVKSMLQNIVGEQESSGIVLRLEKITGEVLKVVLEWLKLYEITLVSIM